MNADPRIIRLAGEAKETADAWSPYKGVQVDTDRERRLIVLEAVVKGPLCVDEDWSLHTRAYLTLDTLNELLRDLLAARADLLKLNGGK